MDARVPIGEKFSKGDDSYMDQAACIEVDKSYFFPEGTPDEKDDKEYIAKKICASCVVINECREFAYVNRIEAGIWGGENEDERKKNIRKLSKHRAAS